MHNLDGYMNKSYGEMMEGAKSADKQSEGGIAKSEEQKRAGQQHLPSLHIHSHSDGHTVHILHKNGRHEMYEHPHGDVDGIAQHIHNYLGGEGSAPEGHEAAGKEMMAGER